MEPFAPGFTPLGSLPGLISMDDSEHGIADDRDRSAVRPGRHSEARNAKIARIRITRIDQDLGRHEDQRVEVCKDRVKAGIHDVGRKRTDAEWCKSRITQHDASERRPVINGVCLESCQDVGIAAGRKLPLLLIRIRNTPSHGQIQFRIIPACATHGKETRRVVEDQQSGLPGNPPQPTVPTGARGRSYRTAQTR